MFRILSVITIFYFIFYATIGHANDTSFNMPTDLLCDKTEKVINFIDNEGYVPIARGVTSTESADILSVIYGRQDSVVFVGIDPVLGFACFVGEISNDLIWMHKMNLPPGGPRTSA